MSIRTFQTALADQCPAILMSWDPTPLLVQQLAWVAAHPFDQNYPGERSSLALILWLQLPSTRSPNSPTNGGYQAYNPNMRRASSVIPINGNFLNRQSQYTNMTDPGPRGSLEGGPFDANAPLMPRPVQDRATGSSARSGGGPIIARLASLAP
jgi:hypothetical protein